MKFSFHPALTSKGQQGKKELFLKLQNHSIFPERLSLILFHLLTKNGWTVETDQKADLNCIFFQLIYII